MHELAQKHEKEHDINVLDQPLLGGTEWTAPEIPSAKKQCVISCHVTKSALYVRLKVLKSSVKLSVKKNTQGCSQGCFFVLAQGTQAKLFVAFVSPLAD